MLKIASWNVNSLKIRLEQILAWLESEKPDILALQETKLIDDAFPVQIFQERGYFVAFAGQKTFNGVAIISRFPLEEIVYDLPHIEDPQRRMVAATIRPLGQESIRIINIYVPNGAVIDSDKFVYKLHWLNSVIAYLRHQLAIYPKLAVMGDFNIAPEDQDVCDPAGWQGSVLVCPEVRAAFKEILNCGLHDSFRHFEQAPQSYSWWDYRLASFRRNLGLRIDHILLSDELKQRCASSGIDVEPRRAERPSDHTPVWVTLDI